MSAILDWVFTEWRKAIPPDRVSSVCDWAEEHVRLVGSARSDRYDRSVSPWTIDIIEDAGNGTTSSSLCKPIQTGGSAAGEVAVLFWLVNRSGDVGYFWPNDDAAEGRWEKRFERIARACDPLLSKVPTENRFAWTKGQILLPSSNLQMRGIHTDRAVASDTIPFICNEELHIVENGWEPGKLAQVEGRQSACWQRCMLNISNAGFANSDWHKKWKAGTQQHWLVKCPGCSQYHEMRCRFEDDKPELGGLRYDAKGCRLGNYEYDYGKLVANGIFYQMPCGFKVLDDVVQRRMLSQSGRYSEPQNKSALPTEKSYIYEAVACDFFHWLDIIKRKHEALKAMATGDYTPYFNYLREIECRFVDIGKDRPAPESAIIISSQRTKNREGLENRVVRLSMADWQQGHLQKGIPPHYWLMIQDWDEAANSLVVWEGRCDTDEELVATLKAHEVKPVEVVLDSSADAQRIYAFCLRHGFNALKADDKLAWNWEDGTQRFYSQPRPLCAVANSPPSQQDPALEPMFWLISKFTAMERLIFLRQSKAVRYEIPADVSKEFLEQFDSWTVEVIRQRDGQSKMKWKQVRDDDHLFQCACGILSMVDLLDGFDRMGGLPQAQNVNEESVNNGNLSA